MAKARTWVRSCSQCGCTEDRACLGRDGQPCFWTGPELCSACDPLVGPFLVPPRGRRLGRVPVAVVLIAIVLLAYAGFLYLNAQPLHH